MTAKRSPRDYVQDILDTIEAVEGFVIGMTYEEFVPDQKTLYAVTRGLEIIGEAANRLPKAILVGYPSIDWRDVTGMRHRIVHNYFEVNLPIIWDTVKFNSP